MIDIELSNQNLPIKHDQVELFNDPFEASKNKLIAMTFIKGSSHGFKQAVSIARGASHHSILSVDDQEIYLSIFEKNKDQASRALLLLNAIITWKTSQYFCGGRLIQNKYQVKDILRCYLAASSLPDNKAHCWIVPKDKELSEALKISGPFAPLPVFPCRHLSTYFHHQKGHPSPLSDLINAAAVNHGCDFCPLFKL